MSKSIFIGVALAALFAVTLAQTQCLPQVRATYNVRVFFNQTDDVCNATTDELEALAGRITTKLFSASTGLDASCSATLDGDSVECKDGDSVECKDGDSVECKDGDSVECKDGDSVECKDGDSVECKDGDSVECKDERTKSNSKSPKGRKGKGRKGKGRKGKGRERSKTSKGDKLEFDVVIACTNGSNPCLLAETNSRSTIVDNFRGILERFQLQNMQSLTLGDMMADAMIRRPKVERFCQVPSTLRRGRGKGIGRRPMTCSKCIIHNQYYFMIILIYLDCPETCPM